MVLSRILMNQKPFVKKKIFLACQQRRHVPEEEEQIRMDQRLCQKNAHLQSGVNSAVRSIKGLDFFLRSLLSILF